MGNRFHRHALTFVAACGIALSGCGARDTAPVRIGFDGTLPAVAAQYRTEVRQKGMESVVVDWRFWREDDRIERENLRDRSGEVWQRDGTTLFHSRLYHAQQRGIDYQPGDLGMMGAVPQWAQQAWIVSPELLQKLTVHSSRERDGVVYQRYKGVYGDSTWDITLRLDSMLPQSIERRQGERIERIDLREVHALAAAPWQPTPSRDYGMIDFADLGDHERDPFVIGLQAAAGAAHAHNH